MCHERGRSNATSHMPVGEVSHRHSCPYLQRPRTQSRQGPACPQAQVSQSRFCLPHSQHQSPLYATMRILGAALSLPFSCKVPHFLSRLY